MARLNILTEEVTQDNKFRDTMQKLSKNPNACLRHSLRNDRLIIFFYKEHMVIPRSSSSVPQNLAEFHDITFEGQLVFFFFCFTYKQISSVLLGRNETGCT